MLKSPGRSCHSRKATKRAGEALAAGERQREEADPKAVRRECRAYPSTHRSLGPSDADCANLSTRGLLEVSGRGRHRFWSLTESGVKAIMHD